MAVAHARACQSGTVTASFPLTPEIRRIEIDVDRPARVEPGAHVDVRLLIEGERQQRSYSIVDASSDGGRISLSIYTSPISRGGAAAMNALAPGDRLELTQPLNDFPLRSGAHSYVLLAGGVGVTALVGMGERLRHLGADYRFVYAGRSRPSMAYAGYRADLHRGRLSLHVGEEGTSLSVPDDVAQNAPGTELYVCGPIRLMDAVRRMWASRGLPVADLRMETFGNSGWFDTQEFTVSVPALGIETTVRSNQSMLEALQATGAVTILTI